MQEDKSHIFGSTNAVRAAKPKKAKPNYVPDDAWRYYRSLRPEIGLSINGVEFNKVKSSKQKEILEMFEDFFERLFYGDAAKEMWTKWAINYKASDASQFVEIVLLSCGGLDVFRKGVAASKKKNKKKNQLIAVSKKLRNLIKSENFVSGLKEHCRETGLTETLQKFETFISNAEYMYDSSTPLDSSSIARKQAMSYRKSIARVDFIRQVEIKLRLEFKSKTHLHFLRSVLECVYPPPENGAYTIENIRRIIRPSSKE